MWPPRYINLANLWDYVRVTKETFAQIGIVENVSYETVTQPSGVDLSDGLTLFESSLNFAPLTAEVKTLIRDRGSHGDITDIHVFSVGPPLDLFTYPNAYTGAGMQTSPYLLRSADSGYANNNSIDALKGKPFTLAHELVHVLTDSGSHQGGLWNLMGGGTSDYNDDIWDSKRLDSSQEQKIWGGSHVH